MTNHILWHEVLAEVMRRYAGKTLPDELMVPEPNGPPGQTLVVCAQRDGLHITLVSPAQP